MELIHTGLVCREMAAAQDQLSALLGVHWVGGDEEEWSLTLEGTPCRLPLRIAHASNGAANFELIEAVAGTPWVTEQELVQHHLCFYAEDSVALCRELEGQGYRRVMGEVGEPQGYFQAPDGLLLEIIGDDLRDYLTTFYQRSLAKAMASGGGEVGLL